MTICECSQKTLETRPLLTVLIQEDKSIVATTFMICSNPNSSSGSSSKGRYCSDRGELEERRLQRWGGNSCARPENIVFVYNKVNLCSTVLETYNL